jgi:cytochrome P450
MPSLELAYDVGITYEAGSDTTTMAMEVFVMATVLYGATFVLKARKEIDNVVGQNRMPAFSDNPALPYLQAVVNEVLRWRPVGAGGVLHAVTKDDEYMATASRPVRLSSATTGRPTSTRTSTKAPNPSIQTGGSKTRICR